jgi:hypothetical protein
MMAEAKVSISVPDSVGYSFIHAVAMNDVYGLGISTTAAGLSIVKNFYVKVNLPNRCKRSEIVIMTITVHSRLTSSQPVTLSVARDDSAFTVVEPSANGWISRFRKFRQIFHQLGHWF